MGIVYHLWITLLILNFGVVEVNAQKSFADVKTAMENSVVYAFENSASIRPVADVGDLLTVSLDLNIAAVNDFNEQNGYIEVSGYLNMDWTPTEGPTEADNFEEFVSNTLMWKPPIILVNDIKKAEEIGWDSNVDIRFNFNTRRCSWRPWIIARSACTPDVKYYPFDRQACSFKFVGWGYNSTEMLLTAASSSITFNFFEENGEWVIGDTSSSAYIDTDASIVEYQLKLTRRPTYYIINLIAPIILLAVLNVFVFILPPDSGERIGYSITCFLSYVVLLNTVMAFLPTSAAPLAYLSYYTFVMMVFSAAMSLATIITLRIHFKPQDEPVTPGVKAFMDCICCKWLTVTDRERTTKVVPVKKGVTTEATVVSWDDVDDDDIRSVDTSREGQSRSVYTRDSANHNDDDYDDDDDDGLSTSTHADTEKHDDDDENTNTWKKLAFYMDVIFFIGFLAGQVFYSVAYLLPIILN